MTRTRAGAAQVEGLLAAGRYAVFHGGRECGQERWRIEVAPEGLVLTGEQQTIAPHPLPSVLGYRIALTDAWRPTGLELHWSVGDRRLVAVHGVEGGRWRVRIEVDGHVRHQEGDFPEPCEFECMTHLSSTVILARRDFQLGGEHEFPVLRIGPPWMAVSPERMLLRCVETGVRDTPLGPVPAKRYVASLPPRGEEEGYAFWADGNGVVLESYQGTEPLDPWMRLVEYEWRAR